MAPTTISGFLAGANPMNQPCAGPWRVLRRTGLAAIEMLPPNRPRSRCATLHHTDHRLPQSRELLGREGELTVEPAEGGTR